MAKPHVIAGMDFRKHYTNVWKNDDEVGTKGKSEANLEKGMLKVWKDALRGKEAHVKHPGLLKLLTDISRMADDEMVWTM